MRFQADLDKRDEAIVTLLTKELEPRSKADLLVQALTMLEWLVKERKNGCRIVTVSPAGNVRELVSPELERVAPRMSDLPSAEINWTSQELSNIASMLDGPAAKPSDHLLQSLRETR